jgi:hypothetical protein
VVDQEVEFALALIFVRSEFAEAEVVKGVLCFE